MSSKVPPPTNSLGQKPASTQKTNSDLGAYKNLETPSKSYPKHTLPNLTKRQQQLTHNRGNHQNKILNKNKKDNLSNYDDNLDDDDQHHGNDRERHNLINDTENNNLGGNNKKFTDQNINNNDDEYNQLTLDSDTNRDGQNRNKHAIEFLQDFLDEPFPNNLMVKSLEKMLYSMLKQCTAGLDAMPEDSFEHQALGKSANLCKHALAALSRNHIIECKKLIKLLVPKR